MADKTNSESVNNLHDLGHKTKKFFWGFLFGSLVVLLIDKFINDNYSFKVNALTNRTEKDEVPEANVIN